VTAENYSVCSVPIAALSTTRAAIALVDAAADRRPFEVHLCNAYTLSLVDDDARLREALLHADLNLADGAPVAWLGHRSGMSGPVRGPSLLVAACREGRMHGLRHYFYGGAPGVAEAAAEQLRQSAPGLLVAGVESPAFKEPDRADLVALAERLVDVEADIVWLGLGTPRQDYVVPPLAQLSGRTVVPVGAAFDFLAGTVRQAPSALQSTGLEWIYRLAADPRRLWRRYLVGNPRFLARVIQHRRLQ
jgi:N-acetylglucosaminyldiphosphoundecaprenol N-acetyl-beta-D-mannosaminyltransferase